MQIEDIENEESLRNWLNARPEESRGWEAAILSWRIAARNLPFTPYADRYSSLIVKRKALNSSLTEVSVRSIAIALNMTFAPASAIALAAALSSARSARSAASAASAARSAESAARSAASAASAARSAASVASAASAAHSAHSAALSADSAHSAALFADSALSALSARPIALFARSAVWSAIHQDCKTILEQGWNLLHRQPLWPKSVVVPDFWKALEQEFREVLKTLPNPHVWLRWYERLSSGKRASQEIEMLYATDEHLPLWKKENGFELVTAWIAERLKKLEEHENLPPKQADIAVNPPSTTKPQITEAELEKIGSPNVVINKAGKLALGPNPVYDQLDITSAGLELVVAQASIINTIEAGLPTEAPKHLRTALVEYQKALPLDGRIGMALVLDVQFPVIIREIKASPDKEYIEKGMLVACKTFTKLHPQIVKFARERKQREKIISAIPFDEEASNNNEIRQGFKILDVQLEAAVAAGIAEPEVAIQSKQDLEFFDSIKPEDRIDPNTNSISPRKRFFLTRIGFLKNLSQAVATIGGATTIAKDGNEALGNTRKAIEALLAFILRLFGHSG